MAIKKVVQPVKVAARPVAAPVKAAPAAPAPRPMQAPAAKPQQWFDRFKQVAPGKFQDPTTGKTYAGANVQQAARTAYTGTQGAANRAALKATPTAAPAISAPISQPTPPAPAAPAPPPPAPAAPIAPPATDSSMGSAQATTDPSTGQMGQQAQMQQQSPFFPGNSYGRSLPQGGQQQGPFMSAAGNQDYVNQMNGISQPGMGSNMPQGQGPATAAYNQNYVNQMNAISQPAGQLPMVNQALSQAGQMSGQSPYQASQGLSADSMALRNGQTPTQATNGGIPQGYQMPTFQKTM